MFGPTQPKINDLTQDKIGYDLPWKQISCTFRVGAYKNIKFGDVQNVDFFFHISYFIFLEHRKFF